MLRKYHEKHILIDIPRRSRRRKITPEMRAVIEEMYNEKDELTSTRIKSLLTERWPDLQVSIPTIKKKWAGCAQDLTIVNFCAL